VRAQPLSFSAFGKHSANRASVNGAQLSVRPLHSARSLRQEIPVLTKANMPPGRPMLASEAKSMTRTATSRATAISVHTGM
jgi:hypothetical protein